MHPNPHKRYVQYSTVGDSADNIFTHTHTPIYLFRNNTLHTHAHATSTHTHTHIHTQTHNWEHTTLKDHIVDTYTASNHTQSHHHMQVADRAVEMLKPYKDELDWDGAFSVVSSYDRSRTEKLGILLYVMLRYVILFCFSSFNLISYCLLVP